MNLDEWAALAPEARDERRRHWVSHLPAGPDRSPEAMEWQTLVMEAEKRFTAIHGGHPDILHIGSSCSFSEDDPVAIFVRTRLDEGELISELPAEWLAFPVEQKPLGAEIASFKRTWASLLGRIFDWSDGTIQDWIESKGHVFRNMWFLHDPPIDFVLNTILARPDLRHLERTERRKIEDALRKAIGSDFYVGKGSGYNWHGVRKEVLRILARSDPDD